MAGLRSLNSNKYIEHLKKVNNDLRSENDELKKKIRAMETNGQRPSQMLASALRRGQQHRLKIENLKKADAWLIIGWFLFVSCSSIIEISFGFSHLADTEVSVPLIPKSWRKLLSVVGYSKIISVAVACLGITIAIIGQCIFPAPCRTFLAVFAFSIKQMADIFLPDWCLLLLKPVSYLVIRTINIDRQKEVSTAQKD